MIGTATPPDFATVQQRLPEIQQRLKELGLSGWLLYDLHARNVVAQSLLAVGELSRRYFVLLPAVGEPTALTHGIEQGPWSAWPWRCESYVGWRELARCLDELLDGVPRIAMEAVDRDAVPAVDTVPWGVVELVRATGVEVASSGELVSYFHSRWSEKQLASHRRASRALALIADASFRQLAERVRRDESVHEGELRDWVVDRLNNRGFAVGAGCIAASGLNAANPHYAVEGAGAVFERGDLVLLDLWAKEDSDAVFADQTWMAVLGPAVPSAVAPIWQAARDARDAGVAFLRERSGEGSPIQGYEVDDVVRDVITTRGYGPAFIHRTGHSIDRETHGSGPNIDNFETHEVRVLIPGVGFSIEPGIYLPGNVGVRTEINVFMGAAGPEVTTPDPQADVLPLLAEG
jgi:Xaa-Pro aminopeptidase